MRSSVKAALVAAATTTLLAPVGAAFAGTATIDDGTGDTYEQVADDSGNTTMTASDVTDNVDLDKVVIKHSGKRVEIRAHYTDLKKSGADFASIALLKTDHGKFFMYGSAMNDGTKWHLDGTAIDPSQQSGRALPVVPRGKNPCPGFETDVDWSTNVLTFSAPRTCLGSPKYVIVHVEDWSNSWDESTATGQSWFDNAHNDKSNEKGWTDKVKKG